MSIVNISSVEEYENLKNNSALTTITLFSAEWAEQCKQVLDVMTELSKQFGESLRFVNIPAEELSEIAIAHEIEAVPTIIFFRGGKAVHRIDGVDIPALTQKCKEFGAVDKSAESLEDRLKALINKGNVVIFMKGSRDTPRCGFSKQLIGIVNELGVQYETFDILSDEEVRQGLKTYSDWPTYPQVYVKGELIGGLDIIKELLASGELLPTLSA